MHAVGILGQDLRVAPGAVTPPDERFSQPHKREGENRPADPAADARQHPRLAGEVAGYHKYQHPVGVLQQDDDAAAFDLHAQAQQPVRGYGDKSSRPEPHAQQDPLLVPAEPAPGRFEKGVNGDEEEDRGGERQAQKRDIHQRQHQVSDEHKPKHDDRPGDCPGEPSRAIFDREVKGPGAAGDDAGWLHTLYFLRTAL